MGHKTYQTSVKEVTELFLLLQDLTGRELLSDNIIGSHEFQID